MDSSNAESTVTTEYHDAIVGDANRQIHALEGEVAELTSRLRWDVAAARVEAFTTESDTFRARGEALVKQISELRAALGDSEARRAELEAAIQAVRDRLHAPIHPYGDKRFLPVPEHEFLREAYGEELPADLLALTSTPSVVLEDRDREVAARAVETFAANLREWYPDDVFPRPTDESYHDLHVALARTNITLDRFSADLMRRAAGIAEKEAAAIRKGDNR